MSSDSGRRKLPDFLIIGAPKCGTSWLGRNLAAHPQLDVYEGELHYFSRHFDEWTVEQYQELLGSLDGRIVGEKSNTYLTDPGVAARIRDVVPGVKLIAALRDPVDRAYSSYCMQMDRGSATDDIRQFMSPQRTKLPHIIQNGCYADQLKIFYQLFPANQLFVITLEEIRKSPESVYQTLTDFLNAARFDSPVLRDRVNERGAGALKGGLGRLRWLMSRSRLANTPFSRRLMQSRSVKGVARSLLSPLRTTITYPAMPKDLRAELQEYYRDDIGNLEHLTGRNFSSLWLAPEPKD